MVPPLYTGRGMFHHRLESDFNTIYRYVNGIVT